MPRVQEVSEAYEVLSDEGKRAEFDRFGSGGGGGAQDPFSQVQRTANAGSGIRIWSVLYKIDHLNKGGRFRRP